MKLMAAVNTAARAVRAVSTTRRRCGAATNTPVSGARSATNTAETVSARPSQLAGEVPPGSPSPTVPVR